MFSLTGLILSARTALERKKNPFFTKETPEIKNYYFPKIYNDLTRGLTLDLAQYDLAKTMFHALVDFIHLQNEFKPPKRLNCTVFPQVYHPLFVWCAVQL